MVQARFDASSVARASRLESAPIVAGATVSKASPEARLQARPVRHGRRSGDQRTTAPFVATVHGLHGRLGFGVGGERHVPRAHDWLAMPANATHDLITEEPTRSLLTLRK
ncbi:MAG: hypothetical protein IPM29_10415 [Planctomycetes bacterium]|nr:hypothetical protein [Planctomycetota bacterium]